MSLKLIATQVIFEPKFSVIISRTLQPSYRSFKSNTIRRKVTLTSQSLCCCSLTLDELALTKTSRNYTTNVSPGSRSTRIEDTGLYSKKPSADIVNKYLQSLTRQASRSGGSLKKFEPCYRPLYPSKKCIQPTYKIPRKLPYVPAVFQPRRRSTPNYKLENPPLKHRALVQWPPLYKFKKKDAEQKFRNPNQEKGDLPPWLLPLYSYKAGRPDDNVNLAEARFSGGAFHRKMEILEGIKEIRYKQTLGTKLKDITKQVESKKPEPFMSKDTAAVNELKLRIGEMYARKGSFKHSGSFQKTQQRRKESGLMEGNKDNSTKGGQLDKHKNLSPENQSDDSAIKHTVLGSSNHSAQNSINVNQVDQTLSSRHLPEMKGTHKAASESKPINFQVSSHSYQKDSTINSRDTRGSKDQTLMNKEDIATDTNEWSVQSLKLRINDMLSYEEEKLNKIASKFKDVVEVPKSSSDGLKAQVNRPSNRSFHRCSLKRAVPKLKKYHSSSRGLATSSNYAHIDSRLPLGLGGSRSYVGRRCFSTFPLLKGLEQPNAKLSVTRSLSQGTEYSAKKPNWITRVKRCFVIKKAKRPKIDDWKKTPRVIPSSIEGVDTPCSPSPVLWKRKENHVTKYQPETHIVQTNPVVLNAERRIMASINRMVPSPTQHFPRMMGEHTANPVLLDTEDKSKLTSASQSGSTSVDQHKAVDRLSEIEKKVRRAEIKVSILPLPWPNEVKNADKIAKLPDLSSSQSDKLSGGLLTEMEKKEETGYQWIMNNRHIVDNIKRRSRQFAGKPLVPFHVKQSIEEYKLPLKAQIAQYRKSIEGRARGLYIYSTKRWYSTSCGPNLSSSFHTNLIFHKKNKPRSCASPHPRFLHRSDMGRFGTRNLSSNASQTVKRDCQSRGLQLKQNAKKDVPVDSDFYSKYALRPMYGSFSRDEPLNRLTKHSNSTKNSSSKPIRTNAVSQIVTPLTSPNKMLHKVGDPSSPSLKKQVDDLKRLIRKTKGLDYVPEKVEEDHAVTRIGETYTLKLKKLVKAAQANAKKLKMNEPKYHTENNTLKNLPGIEKRGTTHEPLRVREPVISNSSTFFTKPENDSRIKSIKTKPPVSRSISVDSLQMNNKPFHNMYSRFKSFLESVRRNSTQEIPSAARNIPSNRVKGSLSLGALLSSEAKKNGEQNEKEVVNNANDSQSNAAVTVELRGGHIGTPAKSIQLWKSEPKASDSHNTHDVENPKSVVGTDIANNGELMSLLTRAKELITFHSQLNAEEHANITRLTDRSPSLVFSSGVENIPLDVGATNNNHVKILTPEEISRNLLTNPETLKLSSKASYIKEGKNNDCTSKVKTQFWPVLTFLPQVVFGKTDQACGGEANRTKSMPNLEDYKSCDNVKSSSNENSLAIDSVTQSSQSANERPENITNVINEKPREMSSLADIPTSTGRYCTNQEDLKTGQGDHCGLVMQNTLSHSKSQNVVPQEAKHVQQTPNDLPKCEVNNSEKSVSNGVLSVNKGSFSKNLKNAISRNDATSSGHPLPRTTSSLTSQDLPKCEVPNSEKSVFSGVQSINWGSISKNFKNAISRNDATSPGHPLPGTTSPLISHDGDSIASPTEASTVTICVFSKNDVAVVNQGLHCNDSNVLVSDNVDLEKGKETNCTKQDELKKRQDNQCGLLLTNTMSHCKAQNVVPEEAKVVTQHDLPKCKVPSSEKSIFSGVSPGSWESFSKNLKNVISRNDATSFKCAVQESCSPLPTSKKDVRVCQVSGAINIQNDQLEKAKYPLAANNFESEHDGNHNAGDPYSHRAITDDCPHGTSFQEPHLSSSSNDQTHNVIYCSSITSPEFEYGVDDIAEEEKEEAHIDEINSHERRSLAELLAKDPTINPELVKKLKLPVMCTEDGKEKTWFTRSRNKRS